MKTADFSTSKTPILLLVLAVLIFAPVLGYLSGTGSNLPAAILAGIALIIIGIVRWQWLLVVLAPLTSTWALLDLGVGLSLERVIAIPAFAGFAFYYATQKPSLPRLPAGGMIALAGFIFVLIIGLWVNPSLVGFDRFFRLFQKIVWCYILFVALTQSGLSGLRRFGFLLMVSTSVSVIAGILALQHFGSDVRLTSISSENSFWDFIRITAIGISSVVPLTVLPIVEMTQTDNMNKKLIFYILFVLFLLLAILTTVNRWILVISPIIILYLGFFGPRKQRFFMLVSLVAGIYIFYNLILPSSQIWQNRYETLLDRTLTEEEGRFSQLETAKDVLQQSPIQGLGLGQAENITQAAASVGVDAQGTSASHNSYLSMLIDVGLFGLLGILALWGSVAYGIIIVRRGLPSGYLNELGRVMPIMMIVLAWAWTVSDAMRSNFTWQIFGFFWAVTWFAQRVKVEQIIQTMPSEKIKTINPQLTFKGQADSTFTTKTSVKR